MTATSAPCGVSREAGTEGTGWKGSLRDGAAQLTLAMPHNEKCWSGRAITSLLTPSHAKGLSSTLQQSLPVAAGEGISKGLSEGATLQPLQFMWQTLSPAQQGGEGGAACS